MILAIDPGNTESAYVLMDKETLRPIQFGKVPNKLMLDYITVFHSNAFLRPPFKMPEVAIEMVASYGMAVGAEVFETVFWIGRFYEAAHGYKSLNRIYRKDVKINLCNNMKAKDSNIRQALIDRFGVVGTKKKPGWFYGFKADIWQAYAVGVTYADTKQRCAEGGGGDF